MHCFKSERHSRSSKVHLYLYFGSIFLFLAGCYKEQTNLDLICDGLEKEKAFVQITNEPALERTEESKRSLQFHFKNKQVILEDDLLMSCSKWDEKSLECEDSRNDQQGGSNHFYLKFNRLSGRILSTNKMYSKNDNIERRSETRFAGMCRSLKS